MIRKSVLVVLVLTGLSGCFFASETPTAAFLNHRVSRGETIYGIARRYGATQEELLELNEVDDPSELAVGQQLVVPDRGLGSEPRARTDIPPPPSTGKIRLGEAAEMLGRMTWPAPRSSVQVTSKFGRRWLKFHDGVDLAGPKGTPIRAAHAGRVIFSGTGLSGYGKTVVIKGRGLLTVYAHNRRNLVDVGDQVAAGDQIAELGDTGNASGPHLHFEVRVPNARNRFVAVDPDVFLR